MANPVLLVLVLLPLLSQGTTITFGDAPYQGTTSYPLNKTCDGLGNTCNAAFCTIVAKEPSCTFGGGTPARASSGAEAAKCQTCAQEMGDPRCSTAALRDAVHGAGGQVNAAYCTDRYLILSSTGAPSFAPNLEDIPMPPGGAKVDGKDTCRTRTWTPEARNWIIPLTAGPAAYVLLPNSHRSNNNNAAAFPSGAGDGSKKYLCTTSRGAFGLPSGGALGLTVDGQDAFPVFNNGAILTPSWCEVDSCNGETKTGGERERERWREMERPAVVYVWVVL